MKKERAFTGEPFRKPERTLGGIFRLQGSSQILCQKDIKDIEGIPKLLLRLEGNEFAR